MTCDGDPLRTHPWGYLQTSHWGSFGPPRTCSSFQKPAGNGICNNIHWHFQHAWEGVCDTDLILLLLLAIAKSSRSSYKWKYCTSLLFSYAVFGRNANNVHENKRFESWKLARMIWSWRGPLRELVLWSRHRGVNCINWLPSRLKWTD